MFHVEQFVYNFLTISFCPCAVKHNGANGRRLRNLIFKQVL